MLTPRDLRRMETLSQGRADDLKIDCGPIRIWLSRVTGLISVERRRAGRWETDQEDLEEVEDPR